MAQTRCSVGNVSKAAFKLIVAAVALANANAEDISTYSLHLIINTTKLPPNSSNNPIKGGCIILFNSTLQLFILLCALEEEKEEGLR